MFQKSEEAFENFTVITYESEWSRQIRYCVNGFWADPVSILQCRKCDDKTKWDKPTISWTSGGVDKGFDAGDVIEAFTEAMLHARQIYMKWKEQAAS